jgi:hypothetical protein
VKAASGYRLHPTIGWDVTGDWGGTEVDVAVGGYFRDLRVLERFADVPAAVHSRRVTRTTALGRVDVAVRARHLDPTVGAHHLNPTVGTRHLNPAVKARHLNPTVGAHWTKSGSPAACPQGEARHQKNACKDRAAGRGPAQDEASRSDHGTAPVVKPSNQARVYLILEPVWRFPLPARESMLAEMARALGLSWPAAEVAVEGGLGTTSLRDDACEESTPQ